MRPAAGHGHPAAMPARQPGYLNNRGLAGTAAARSEPRRATCALQQERGATGFRDARHLQRSTGRWESVALRLYPRPRLPAAGGEGGNGTGEGEGKERKKN